MGLFKIFQKPADSLDSYLRLIQSQILEINEFRNFVSPYEDYQNELYEFQKFITIFISGCLYLIKVKQHLKIEDFKVGDPIYKKIIQTLYSQVLPFYKSYIQNDKIIIGLFNNDLFKDDKRLIIDILARLGKYQNEIKEGFKTGNPYFIEEFETEEYDEEFNIQITGQKIYFEFIRLLFFTKFSKYEDNKLKVEEIDFWELDDDQFELLPSFIKSISNILQRINITPEMLN